MIEDLITAFNTHSEYQPANSIPAQIACSYQFIFFKKATDPIQAPYVNGRCVIMEAHPDDWSKINQALFNGAEFAEGLDWQNYTHGIPLVAIYQGASTGSLKAKEISCFVLNPHHKVDVNKWFPV
eukprot:UN02737